MPDSPTIEQLVTLLGEAPSRIAASVSGLTPAQLHAAPGPDEWSVNDILAHLRACSDMWGRYIQRIIAEDRPTFRAISPRTWINKTDYLTQDFHPSFEVYSSQRADLMALLTPLPAKNWSRSATVTGAGNPLELTVYSYAERLAVHERSHVNQIARIAQTLTR